MKLTRHATPNGPRWALDQHYLPTDFSLDQWLKLDLKTALEQLKTLPLAESAVDAILAPIEDCHEVWASGVTYLRSRDAREAESSVADVYQRVYEAERPELFFKANGTRVLGSEAGMRLRKDSSWDVPEPELTLIINSSGEIVGYTAGNDLSSRSIEGENPLYLPQAKCFDGCCSLGTSIEIVSAAEMADLAVELNILRDGSAVFSDKTLTSNMKRSFPELVSFLFRELTFPCGVVLMTGTGIVPDETFTLQQGDQMNIRIGNVELTNSIS